MKTPSACAVAALLCLSLSACGGVNLWPFGGGDKSQERSKAPANATAYQCASNKRFYVRNLEDNAVWLILPDRELRLNKAGEGRYSNGFAVLDLSGAEASFAEGAASIRGCKAASAG